MLGNVQRFENAGKKNVRYMQKWETPQDPFEKEAVTKSIKPSHDTFREERKKRINRHINDLETRFAKSTTPEPEKKQIEQQLQFYYIERLKEDHELLDGKIATDWWKDFMFWLAGKGAENDHQKSPWYRTPLLTLPGVWDYWNSFLKKRHSYHEKLEKLRRWGPYDLTSAYLYFKFMIRGNRDQESTQAFLKELELLEPGQFERKLAKDKVDAMEQSPVPSNIVQSYDGKKYATSEKNYLRRQAPDQAVYHKDQQELRDTKTVDKNRFTETSEEVSNTEEHLRYVAKDYSSGSDDEVERDDDEDIKVSDFTGTPPPPTTYSTPVSQTEEEDEEKAKEDVLPPPEETPTSEETVAPRVMAEALQQVMAETSTINPPQEEVERRVEQIEAQKEADTPVVKEELTEDEKKRREALSQKAQDQVRDETGKFTKKKSDSKQILEVVENAKQEAAASTARTLRSGSIISTSTGKNTSTGNKK